MSSEAIRRRAFLLFSGGAAALLLWPHRLSAQQPPAKVYRIFWASTESQPDPFVDGFREGLRERGYVEGKNFILELRYAPGNPDALRAVLSELTRSKVDLAVSSGPAIRAMKRATDVPVLFAISGDPVELGLVKSLNRPGGNFTGSTFLSLDLAGKRVEMLKEVFPRLRRLAVLSNTDHPGERSEWQATTEAQHRAGLCAVHRRAAARPCPDRRGQRERRRDAGVPGRRNDGAPDQDCSIRHFARTAFDVRLERVR